MTAIFILVRKNILFETMCCFTQKLWRGCSKKLERLEPLSPIAGAATGKQCPQTDSERETRSVRPIARISACMGQIWEPY